MPRQNPPPAFDARVHCDRWKAEMLRQEIGKVRCWLTGFQAAGKAGPPGEDSLRQVQLLLREFKWPREVKNDSA